MDVAVWEDRKLHYQPRSAAPVSSGTATCVPENGGGVVRPGLGEGPLRVDWSDVANAVSVTYERDGELMRTPLAVDSRSITRHIRRERHVANIGESTGATAVQRRDTELNLRSELRPGLPPRVWPSTASGTPTASSGRCAACAPAT